MKTLTSTSLIIFIIALFFACSDDKKKEESVENLTYKEIQIGKTIEDCDTTEDCASIYFYYPVFSNEFNNPVIDSINNFVMSRLLLDEVEFESSATLEKVVNDFIEDYKMQLEDFPDYTIPWYSKTNATVVYQNENYLTLKIDNESYTGGAHPNSFTNYFVINKSTGKEVRLSELFKPGFSKELNNIVAEKFRKVRNITSNKSLNDEGFWFEENQNIFNNNNFGLTGKGILFYYNPYDVAPYSYGPTLVEISYSELNDIMNL